MSKFKFWLNIILIIISVTLISWNLADFNQKKISLNIEENQPNYQINNTVTHIYDSMGKLTYKLISDEIYHFSRNQISWFINPILTTYTIKSIPNWAISANKAQLTHDNMLYLYGNVQVSNLNLTLNLKLQKILMQNAIINLITQDVLSNDKITVIGIGLQSIGMQMRGNLRNHTVEIMKDVKTYYYLIPNK